MPKQQMKHKQSASQDNGAKLISSKKRGSPRQTIPVRDRLRVVVTEPAGTAHVGDNANTRGWLSNPMFLLGILAVLAMAGIELYALTQLL
jgi:hypothetical protein